MFFVIVNVERATCVFVSGSARVVFSQWCALFLSEKTVDPFVEDNIFVIRFVVMGFGVTRSMSHSFGLAELWLFSNLTVFSLAW